MNYLSKFLAFGILLELLVICFAFIESSGDSILFFKASARLSGRVSLLFFGLLFVYATLNPSVERGSDSLRKKFVLARNFAVVHVIHWFFLATAIKLSGTQLVPIRLTGGALAYLMVVVFPVILTGKFLTSLSLKWPLQVYLTYVWVIFFMTYLSRVSSNGIGFTGILPVYQVLFFITSALMVWRVVILFSKQRAVGN